jgi:hypothetical protein
LAGQFFNLDTAELERELEQLMASEQSVATSSPPVLRTKGEGERHFVDLPEAPQTAILPPAPVNRLTAASPPNAERPEQRTAAALA